MQLVRQQNATTEDVSRISASIVVPVLEEPQVFDLFLSSLHDTLPEGVQLILVDDGNGSATRDTLQRWHPVLASRLDVMLLSNSRPMGDGVAFNLGLARCRGDVVIRLDSDLMFRDRWLDALLEPFKATEVGVVGGVLLYPQSGGINHAGITFHQFVGRHLFLNARPDVLPRRPYPVQALALPFAAIRRSDLEAAGGFDAAYHSGYDDLDLALRIAGKGRQLLVTKGATAFHWERSAGPHRDAGRKRNLALFWHRWGGTLTDDLWMFFGDALSNALEASRQQGGELMGVDLCGDRVGADCFWHAFRWRIGIDISVSVVAHRVSSEGAIALPIVLGSDAHREGRRMVMLVDNFARLRGNAYFLQRRQELRTDDVAVDLHGNVVLLASLAGSAWPGEKVR